MPLLLGIHLKVTFLQENKGNLKRGVLSRDNPCTIAFKTPVFEHQYICISSYSEKRKKNPFKLWYYTTHTCLTSPQPNATLEVEKMPFLNVICLNCICSFPVSTTPISESIFLCGNLLSTLTFKKWIFCFLAEFNLKKKKVGQPKSCELFHFSVVIWQQLLTVMWLDIGEMPLPSN